MAARLKNAPNYGKIWAIFILLKERSNTFVQITQEIHFSWIWLARHFPTKMLHTSSYLPWFWQRRARLFNCLATSGWSLPNTWKKRHICSKVLTAKCCLTKKGHNVIHWPFPLFLMHVYKEARPPCTFPVFRITQLNCLGWLPPTKQINLHQNLKL